MAVLWKKAKFAGLLADLRSHRRRRSSLIVQTGFPTSVADLILKNSSRFKSPSSFHTKHKPDSPPPSPDTIPSAAEPPLADPPQTHRPEIPRSGSGDLAGTQPSAAKCLPSLLKLFFILVFAFGTKQIAGAITASALLLFLFEFLGKRHRPHPRPNQLISFNSEIRASSSDDDVDEMESRLSSNSSFEDGERNRATCHDDLDEIQSHAHEKRSEDPAATPDSKRGKMKKSRSAVFKDKLLAKIMPKRHGSRRDKSVLPSKPAFESAGGGHQLRDPPEQQDDRGQFCTFETSAGALTPAKSAPSLVNLGREKIIERRGKRSGGGGDGFVFAVILAAMVVGGRGAALVGAVVWFAVARWAGVRFKSTSMYKNSSRTLCPFVDVQK